VTYTGRDCVYMLNTRLSTDSEDDTYDVTSSRRWPPPSSGSTSHRHYTSPLPPPLVSGRVAEYLVDAMTLQPNGDASDVET